MREDDVDKRRRPKKTGFDENEGEQEALADSEVTGGFGVAVFILAAIAVSTYAWEKKLCLQIVGDTRLA